MSPNIKTLTAGFLFAFLWGSASTATKNALYTAQPFTISVFRFFTAAAILLFAAHVMLKEKLPGRQGMVHLMIYGLLNITIYLGFFIIGMQYVSAGIASLLVATNPVFISILASVWLKHPLKTITVISLLICSAGILVASYPLLQTSYVTPEGLLLLLLSMISYSLASLYFTGKSWKGIHILTINGWQTLFGGIFTLPFFLFFYESEKNHFSAALAFSVLWLAVPVSIGAVLMWMYLLKNNPVKASFWLYLCPIFGIFIASVFLKEPVSAYTFAGVIMVLAGLYLVQHKRNV